jgi:hypothetical protein
MLKKSYKYQGNTSINIDETVVDCERTGIKRTSSNTNNQNPNIPLIGTQEEWWEHFHKIEQGEFVTWEEHKKKFNEWKRNYLASLI